MNKSYKCIYYTLTSAGARKDILDTLHSNVKQFLPLTSADGS